MKTNSLLLLLFSLVATILPVHSQDYPQYFDGEDTSQYYSLQVQIEETPGNIWQIGPPQKSLFNSASSVPNVIVTDTLFSYPAGNKSSFTVSTPTNFWSYGTLALQWNQKVDFREYYDGGIVEFSIDTGKTWMNVFQNPYVYNWYGFSDYTTSFLENGEMGFTGTDTTWRNVWLCFDLSWLNFFNNDSLLIRFTSTSSNLDLSTSNLDRNGWMIDNMLLYVTISHTLAETKQEEYLEVYPNPTTGRVHIQSQKLNEYHIIEQIRVFDESGKLVKSYGVSPTKFFIDLDDQPDGIYTITITTNLKEESFRILLQKE